MLLIFNVLCTLLAGVYSAPQIGVFYTDDLHAQNDPWRVNRDVIDDTCHAFELAVTGIKALRIFKEDAVLAHSYIEHSPSGRPHFVTGINSWSDTKIPWAQVGWFGIGADDFQKTEYQAGEWNQGLYGNDWIPLDNERRISFAKPFSTTPTVLPFVNAIAQLYGGNYRFDVSTSSIDTYGFTLHTHSWSDTILFGAGVSWIAYPSNKQLVASGWDSSGNYRSWESPWPFNGRYVQFPSGTFQAPPQIFIALRSFDYGRDTDFLIEIWADQITKDGFVWHADGAGVGPNIWPTIYGVGISWLAFA